MAVRFYLAAVLVLFGARTHAQFSETVEVRLLEIEATVVDRDQNAIVGLTPEDFDITIDGRPATITNFSPVTRGVIRDGDAAMPVPTRLIIVVDDLSLRQEPKQRALRALRKYVDETMDPSTTATLITWNGSLTTRTTPTTRREILRSAIDASAREIPRGMAIDAEKRQIQRLRGVAGYPAVVESYARSRAIDARSTLDALGLVISGAAQAAEGRKILLFITEGVPIQPGAEWIGTLPPASVARVLSPELMQDVRVRELSRQAQEGGVLFTTVDPSHATDSFELEGLVQLARETGGSVVSNRNDLDRALAELDERMSDYYSIAVRTAANAATSPRIEVRVKDHPKWRVHVATRRGLASRDEAIANAVRAQLTWRNEENPLDVRLSVQTEQHERGCIASLQFLVPADKLTLLEPSSATRGQLDFWFTTADASGTESGVKMQSLAVTSRHGATIGHAMPLALASGDYVISTAIVDRLSGVMSFLQREVECGR